MNTIPKDALSQVDIEEVKEKLVTVTKEIDELLIITTKYRDSAMPYRDEKGRFLWEYFLLILMMSIQMRNYSQVFQRALDKPYAVLHKQLNKKSYRRIGDNI